MQKLILQNDLDVFYVVTLKAPGISGAFCTSMIVISKGIGHQSSLDSVIYGHDIIVTLLSLIVRIG